VLQHSRAALARLGEVFRRRARSTAEADEEFAFHIEMETAENMRHGMSRNDARRTALLRFGGTQRFRDEVRDARGVVALDNLARDARFAFRRLRRAPAFAVGVIVTLGVGVGAAVGIGSIVYGVLIRDLPYPKPDQLVRVGFLTPGIAGQGDLQSDATYLHFAKSARSFSALGMYWTTDQHYVSGPDAPERVTMAMMTPNVFTLLGVRPMLGRLFAPHDTSWYGESLLPVLISEHYWRQRYGGDSSVVGRHIGTDFGTRVIIGVLPQSFAFPTTSVDLFFPAPVPVNHPQITGRSAEVIGRLRNGVTIREAQADLDALVPALTVRFPTITREMLQNSGARVAVESLKSATVAPVRPQLVLLGMLVAIVLLIATTNVANLFLLRVERASAESAIARSLGAGRLALARRFVLEGIVLGLASVVVALPAATLALSTKFGFTEGQIPRLHEVSFTSGTIALLLGSTVLIGAVVGLVAASRPQAAGMFDHLRASHSTLSGTRRRAQHGLVAFQLAVALVLLVAAGLLGRSFWNLRSADIGFRPHGAMTFQLSLPYGRDGYTQYARSAEFEAKLADRLAALPGVTSVGVAERIPLASSGAPNLDMQVRAADGRGRTAVEAAHNMASAEYFRAIGIPLRAGQTFHTGDLHGAPAVVVSVTLAKALFGTTDAVGRQVLATPDAGTTPRTFRIVGVVGDVQWGRIEDGNVPMVYFPILRDGDGLPADSNAVWYTPMHVQYVVRGTGLPSGPAIQRIVAQLDSRVPAAGRRTLASIVDDATARVRLTLLLIAVAGAAALLLAVIGVYSVVAYAAAGRTREFGIRLALGAAPGRIGGMILREGLSMAGVGTVLGLLAALGATRFLGALLYDVKPTGVAEFAGATVLLIVVTLIATLLPARRAARTPSAIVLRGE
jgi:putative ABC transport system permease protein